MEAGSVVWAEHPNERKAMWPAMVTAATKTRVTVRFFGQSKGDELDESLLKKNVVEFEKGVDKYQGRRRASKFTAAMKEAREHLQKQVSDKDDTEPNAKRIKRSDSASDAGDSSDNNVEIDVGPDKDNSDAMTYEEQRLANIRRNQEMMAKLNLKETMASIAAPSSSSASKPSSRGLHKKRKATAAKPLPPPPRTRSQTGSLGASGTSSATGYVSLAPAEPVLTRLENDFDLAQDPFELQAKEQMGDDGKTLSKKADDDDDDEESKQERKTREACVAMVKRLGSVQIPTPKLLPSKSYIKSVRALKMDERCVAKVVPDRIFSVAIHPTEDKVLAMTGDKSGHVGFFDADNPDEASCVTTFRPHIRPVSAIHIDPTDATKVMTSSYDSSVRMFDFGAQRNTLVHLFDQDELPFLQYSDHDFASQTTYGCHSGGVFTISDARSGKSPHSVLHLHSDKKISFVDIHPTQRHVIATSGLDNVVYLWDTRMLGKRGTSAKAKPKPLSKGVHARSISNATFSPQHGNSLVSLGHDDLIKVWSLSGSHELSQSHSIKHNNHTGRWLTNFRVIWDPKNDSHIIVGAMERPRGIHVIDTASGSISAKLSDDEHFTSVTSIHAAHPSRHVIVGGNSSGRLFVLR